MENNITYATEFCDWEIDIFKILLKFMASDWVYMRIWNLIIIFITNMLIESGDVFIKVLRDEIGGK